MSSFKPRTIVVVGDPAVLRLYQVGYELGPPVKNEKMLSVNHKLRTPLFNEIPEHVRFWRLPWGAGLVHELIEYASTAREPAGEESDGYSYVWAELPDKKTIDEALSKQDADFVVQAAGRWEDYWDGRWRVRQTTGPTRPPIRHYGDTTEEGIKKYLEERVSRKPDDPGVLVTVIDDLGHDWAVRTEVNEQLKTAINLTNTLIVKLETLQKRPYLGKLPRSEQDDFRYSLIPKLENLLGLTQPPSEPNETDREMATSADSAPASPIADKQLILHVHLRSLRDAGSNISQSLSWEGATEQIAIALGEEGSPLFNLFTRCKWPTTIVVSLGHAGCVIASTGDVVTHSSAEDSNASATGGGPDGADGALAAVSQEHGEDVEGDTPGSPATSDSSEREAAGVEQPDSAPSESVSVVQSAQEIDAEPAAKGEKGIQVRLVADFSTLELLPERRYSGQSFGSGRYVLASLAAAAARKQPALTIDDIAKAVRSGVEVGRDIFDNGYGDRRVRLGLAKREEVSRKKLGLLDNESDPNEWKYKIISYRTTGVDKQRGPRLWGDWANPPGSDTVAAKSVLGAEWKRWDESQRKELVQELVRTGRLEAPVPSFQVGKWISYDREEIERAREVMLAVGVYLDQNEEKEFPFGMTVFGSPGSGKSFFVKQLIEMLNREVEGRRDVKKIKKIEINLSQLRDESDLLYEFDKVRDVSAQGMIPAVLWDEFDSNLQAQKYGWIKSFLDPLQQGKYRRERDVGDLGKALFIFAGGTCSTINDWESLVAKQKILSPELKLHDFDSRVRVRFEIRKMGFEAESSGSGGAEQREFSNFKIQIRRAAVLRGQLLQWWPNLTKADGRAIDIADDVIEELVFTDQFRYDVRSMEQIVRASALTGSTRFERSALPPSSVSRGHLEALGTVDLVTTFRSDGV